MCWIFLFPVAVISMIVLLMKMCNNSTKRVATPKKYENDRHTLKRNMARGRCGLPGMPNKKFFQKDGTNECEADQEKEPFEKEMKVLKTDINDHRKQIEETKERVINADKQLLTIDVTATGMKKKYDMIMHLLKEDILDAEEEYQLLNKKMASANELRQKFYSLENECEGMNNPNNPAANCNEDSFSRRSSSNGMPKQQTRKLLSSCCVQSSYSNDQRSQKSDNSSDSEMVPYEMNASLNSPGNRSSGMNPSYASLGGENPFKRSGSYSSFSKPGMVSSYNAPGMRTSSSNVPPDPCDKYPRPPCCPPPKPAPPPPPPPNPCHPPIKRPRRKDGCDRPGVPFCCKYPAAPDYGFPPQKCPGSHTNMYQPSLDSITNGSLSSSLAVRKTSTSVRNSNSSSVVNRGGRNSSSLSKNQDITTPNDTSSRKSKSGSQTSGLNRSGSPQRSSCCSGRAASPQRGTSSSMDYGRVGQPGSSCCSGSVGKPDPCAPPPPPTYCPGRSACACCKCEPPPVPVPRCPPSKLVKMPPYSTFFDERMPVKPCVPEKDSETIGDIGSDNISYDTQEINEDDKCTFPPKCCRTVYEDFVKKRNVTEPPKVKLPMIIDPCDPCAEIPREISPFEDVVNISHTCGTQTNEDQKDEKCCSNYPLRKSRIIP